MVRRHLPGHASRAGWEQVSSRDIQRWMSWLLDRYSTAYASNQYRALQQFFKWLAAEDELADPMAGLRPPRVPDELIPVFTGQDLTWNSTAGPHPRCSAATAPAPAAPAPAAPTTAS